MVIRRRNPRVTFMLFQTGKCIVTGAKTEEDNRKAIRQFARHLSKFIQVKYKGFEVNTVSAAFNLGHALNLNRISHPQYFYSPETFAGGILNYKEKRSLMLFHTGCVTMAGCKSIKELQVDYQYVLQLLQHI